MSLLPEHFHFIRPAWFWALLPLFIFLWLHWRQKLMSRSWRNVVDPKLLPHLLMGKVVRKQSWSIIIFAITGILIITALAGPVWNKLEQPVFRSQSALVILLDLSRSMDAADIKPSRLNRAKLKLHDILKQRQEGQTAIITYAADPFVVTPLTTDTKTISSQLSGLNTDLMPMQGSRADRAIEKGITLLKQAGMNKGVVMLVTDGIEGAPINKLNQQIQNLVSQGYQLLILGVGTEEGAPIPQATGGFFKDSQGNIILPKLDSQSLTNIAIQGQGRYHSLSADDNDINHLLSMVDTPFDTAQKKLVDDMKSDQWQDQGYWLILPVMLLAAFSFRRGYLLLLLILILPAPEPAYAFDWSELWSTDNQRAQQTYEKGEPQKAAELFEDSEWRAAAYYKSGNYEASLKEQEKITEVSKMSHQHNAKNLYNKGNVLAQMQRFPDALAAYEEALKQDPELEDAKFNRDLIQKWMQQNPSQNENKTSQQDKQSNSETPNQDENKQSDEAGNQESEQQSAKDSKSGQSSEQKKNQQDNKQKDDAAQAKKDLQQNKKNNETPANEKQNTAAEKSDPQDADKNNKKIPAKMASKDNLDNETDQATEQWLRRIPDDPAGLWRRKFLYQYQKQYQSRKEEDKPW